MSAALNGRVPAGALHSVFCSSCNRTIGPHALRKYPTTTPRPPPPPSLSAHNARFDFHFLNAEFARARWKGGLSPGVCTLALAKKVLGGAGGQQGGSYRLGDLVQVRVALEGVTLRVETKLLIA